MVATVVTALPLGAGCARPLASAGSQPQVDPFTVGVASGDPTPDGAVLWTRLAPRPLADGGLGGMPARPVEVEWEFATAERTEPWPRVLLPVPDRRSPLAGGAHPHRTGAGRLGPGTDDVLRELFTVRARMVHCLPPAGC